MRIRTHSGVSLDGFVATRDGLPAWDAIPTFGPVAHSAGQADRANDAWSDKLSILGCTERLYGIRVLNFGKD